MSMSTTMKAAAFVAAAACCPTLHAFQSHVHHHSSTSSSIATSSPAESSSSRLFAKKKKPTGGGKGFGASTSNPKKEPKYSINDKSYGQISPTVSVEQTIEEAQSSMTDFFTTYSEWKPLFRNVMGTGIEKSEITNMASSSFLSETEQTNLWGISTLEQRHPWRLLPAKPTSNSSLQTLSTFLDEWQQSLLDIPLDSLITGENDLHFLEEGRRTLVVTRFHVLDEYHTMSVDSAGSDDADDDDSDSVVDIVGDYDWKTELFRTCWSELAHLMSQDDIDTGSLILLPDVGELEYVQQFVEANFVRPLEWLGRHEDWEISAMERGSVGVRLLYKLSDIPDLSERDSGGDEEVKLF